MAAAKFVTRKGTKVYYGEVGTDPATQLIGLKGISDIAGGEDIDEFETTRLDAVDESDAIDWTKTHEPAGEDPGHVVLTFGDDENLEVILRALKRTHKAWKLVYASGSSDLYKDGWVKSVKRQGNDDGEWELMVKIRVNALPEFTEAA